MPTYLPVPWTPPQLPVPYQPIPVPQIQSSPSLPQLPPRMAQPIFPRPMFRAGSIGGAGFAGPGGAGSGGGFAGTGAGGGFAGGSGGAASGASAGPTISSTVTPPPPPQSPPSATSAASASPSARALPPPSNLPPPPNLPEPPLYGPAPLAPASSSVLPSWATKNLRGGNIVHGVGTGVGANIALNAVGADQDYTSTPLGRILGATRRGIGVGAFGGPVGGIVGGLGAGLGQAGLEGGQAFANTGVGRQLSDASNARAEDLARARESGNPLEKAYGYVQGFGEAFQPGNQFGQALNLFRENDLESSNVGNLGSDSGEGKAQAQAVQGAYDEEQRRIVADQRRARVEASSPENLDYMLNRLPMTPQSRAEIRNEYLSQLAVLEEQYRTGGLTVPEPVVERDGKMYVGDRPVSSDQVQTVKNGDQEVKVVYRQANDDDLDDMQVDMYQRIVQAVPEVVAADREQTAQMNRMLGYSTALQYALEPYQAQAQQLGATYQQAAGSNPLLAPFAQAFQIGQQGISDAYGAQAAVLPYQAMLEQQAKAQAAQAEQQAMLERQKELERYKKELGASTYQQSSDGADALSGLNLGG